MTSDASIRLLDGFPEFLATRGWDVHVVSSRGDLLDRLASTKLVTTHPLEMAREPAPLSDIAALVRWIRLLRKVRPDVMSVGTPKAGLLGGVAGVLTRTPSRVYLLRGLRLETVFGAKRRVLKFLEKVASASAHKVLAVSDSLRAEFLKLEIASEDKVVVLGAGSSNGVDVGAFSPNRFTESNLSALRSELGLTPGVPVVGFVGRLNLDKGLDVLVDARRQVIAQGTNFQLLIVGGIDSPNPEEDVAFLSEAGNLVCQTGHVEDPAIYYGLVDVLCLPTRREGFPNVVLEAAAMGIPTVTTSATGAVDSVVEGVTGLIVPVGSAHSLAEGLTKLIRDPERRKAMGEAARARTVEFYSRNNVWDLYAEFYDDLITSAKGA
ncbi:glycosyltransferase family 4 protein [Salinibacterium hongtaonis]|uniref:glycosyltransferase family 4 protein n=1 Tax=Homoserinimonas hongtaonis TaxID=2079791 RepID=UPI00131F1515|nr:glycosyltransferase family 4 protein [Salinibacterium hongtaonis]